MPDVLDAAKDLIERFPKSLRTVEDIRNVPICQRDAEAWA
jgi:hypothetical protein